MKKIFCLASFHFFCMFLHCQAQQITNTGMREAKTQIEASNKRYFLAFEEKDSAEFINCYTTDCWIMEPNTPTLCGVEAPLDFFKNAYKVKGVRNGKFITIEIFGNDDKFITELGFWQTFDVNNKILDNGKFLVLWKNTPDGWKRFRDSFSSDRNN